MPRNDKDFREQVPGSHQNVFDEALESTHPIFHPWLKAAKQQAENTKKFDEAAEKWLQS